MAALRLGLIPRGSNDDERELVAAFAAAFGQDVDLHRAADYGVVLAGLKQGLVDVAWLPPLVAGRALRASVADPVAVVVRYGVTSYKTVLVVPPASPLHAVADLRGARVAWVDRESASGYAVVRTALQRAGVRLTEAFGSETFVRSHAAVARAVLEGQVDVGATCAHLEDGAVRFARTPAPGDTGLAASDLRVLFEAGPIPSDVIAVRRSAPARVRSVVEGALLRGEPARLHAAARAYVDADTFATPTAEHRRLLASLVDD
ncbi:MAG TPA: PhnD/SsuA/transferrin family substrate-binding protein [Polyangiaceae bacterium]